ERERRKEQKAKEKEEEKEKKRLEKEEKAKEKRIAADLAEVNKSKLDKKDSTPEMIVDLPASIDGQSVDTQIRQFLRNLGVDATLYQSHVPNVIRWRRKMKAKWNPELNHWEPLEHMRIENEKHVMCIMSAKEFVALAMVQLDGQDVETHVAKVKSAYEDCIPIYMIEGLQVWMRKNRTAENRAYQAKVLNQAQSDQAPSGSQAKRKKAPVEIVDEDVIEDALLRLQVMNGCLVHHTTTSIETAEWVANFTQHISTIPYRMQRMNLETSFCMESGQVKSGEDKDDTFVKMLQEIVRVTPPIAYGIASEYPSVLALVKAFRKHGPLVLEDLQKSANRNGALTDRKIGPAISRRLYKVFMDSDAGSTDV
ncbi:ERCC4 domain-containing protein, partial [Usnea florida]